MKIRRHANGDYVLEIQDGDPVDIATGRLFDINNSLIELDTDLVNALDRLASVIDSLARTVERMRD